MVAETPLNQASSRSHCVFTLHIEARRAGADALVSTYSEPCSAVQTRLLIGSASHTLCQQCNSATPPPLQVRRSKLHFVDLAGSERVGKSGLAAHMQLKEAKHINLSLHFLEQVGRAAGRERFREDLGGSAWPGSMLKQAVAHW